MDTTTFFSQLLGLYFLIVSIIWLGRRNQLKANFKDMIMTKGLLAFSASISLLFGLIIAIVHTVWEWNNVGLVTFIGYFLIFKGVMRFGFPNEVKKYYTKFSDKGFTFCLVVTLVIGIYLTYTGFRLG